MARLRIMVRTATVMAVGMAVMIDAMIAAIGTTGEIAMTAGVAATIAIAMIAAGNH